MKTLLRIEAPHFVAGAVFKKMPDKIRCVRASPIIKYFKDSSPATAEQYCKGKGWRFDWID